MHIISDGGLSDWNTYDTIDAILLTKHLSYIDGVKLDVRKSLDNVLVLSKYDDLSQLTLSNKMVSDSNYDYLHKVKFPSHIFKYYIPTLEEILSKYERGKIIVLEIYDDKNIDILLLKLEEIIQKYSYQYYYISSNRDILNKIKSSHLNDLGIVLDNFSNIKIYKNLPDININLDNIFIITEHPKKIYRDILNSTKREKEN